ncbi:MAG TPA: hypothetical protein VFZ26_17850 [Gemmatimonadales bacterium]
MSIEALGMYLNDHLAGSVAAVEMIDQAIEDNAGTQLAAGLAGLVSAIREDQDVLRGLLQRLDVGESSLKKAGAWLAEKAGRVQLGRTDKGPLRRLEMLEVLGLGIQGKLALWRALQEVAHRHPELAAVDLLALERRAREQHEQVEAYRLAAVLEAF